METPRKGSREDAAAPEKTPNSNPLPPWRGFNLNRFFTHTKEIDSIPFGDQLDWVAGWGFDFVRLPLSYRSWAPEHWGQINPGPLDRMEEIVDVAVARGLHVSVNLHRVPGYCVSSGQAPEPFSLWKDAEALEACTFHWLEISRRLKDRPAHLVSYNFLNEPPKPDDHTMAREDHERVIRALVKAVRDSGDRHRILVDGLNWGTRPIPELADLAPADVHQSCRAYCPFELTHYRAHWVGGRDVPVPTWPGAIEPGHEPAPKPYDADDLRAWYRPWTELFGRGVGVHCGEGGCYNRTPRPVMMAWWRDLLTVLAEMQIGWAVWGLSGPFGVLDHGRDGITSEAWHGHALDRELLDLLRAFLGPKR